MKFGLFGINTGPLADPAEAREVAVAAEEAGFDSVWTGEHVVLPDPQVAPSPAAPDHPMLDPLVALGYLAACTKRVLLATGIIILPQRNPLVLAKEVASLDVLSGGRAVLGIGAGYLGPEFAALGIPMKRRGKRTDEYIDAMRSIWSQEQPAFEGEFASFSGIQARPRPVQQPGPSIVVGGHSPSAYRRAVQRGNGWYGFARDADATAADIQGLQQAADRYERPAELGPLEISVSPRARVEAETVERFSGLGVDRLVWLGRPGQDMRGVVDTAASVLS